MMAKYKYKNKKFSNLLYLLLFIIIFTFVAFLFQKLLLANNLNSDMGNLPNNLLKEATLKDQERIYSPKGQWVWDENINEWIPNPEYISPSPTVTDESLKIAFLWYDRFTEEVKKQWKDNCKTSSDTETQNCIARVFDNNPQFLLSVKSIFEPTPTVSKSSLAEALLFYSHLAEVQKRQVNDGCNIRTHQLAVECIARIIDRNDFSFYSSPGFPVQPDVSYSENKISDLKKETEYKDSLDTYTQVRYTTFGPNGTYTYIGNTLFGPDGSYTKIGNSIFGPDDTYTKLGSSVFSDEGTYTKIGDTVFGPNGTYTQIGNTVFGPDDTFIKIEPLFK